MKQNNCFLMKGSSKVACPIKVLESTLNINNFGLHKEEDQPSQLCISFEIDIIYLFDKFVEVNSEEQL
ncbi:hypothetical protein LWI29_012818 [Acer saccharum]|uniref:Uncharacterized protein n=1 Tax=Acer saccharum TaxID=4024 RepID=A0AA39SGX0_ACESA|nr:hypothetical protein LWI29_012818 [Acer saccharum]